MATPPPKIYPYHCICTSLLLASTHTLTSLPRRTTTTGGLDSALILPLPAAPPRAEDPLTVEDGGLEGEDNAEQESRMEGIEEQQGFKDYPSEGYSMLLGMTLDKDITIIRREDGFEKRFLYRCVRCRLVVGYAIQGASEISNADVKGKANEAYNGQVIYLLPGGIMSTEVMAAGGKLHGGGRIGEEDVDVKSGSVGAFE